MPGRAVASVGIVAGIVYLVWRVTSTLQGTPLWLSGPMLAVEVVAFLAFAVLTWALWLRDGAPIELDVGVEPLLHVAAHADLPGELQADPRVEAHDPTRDLLVEIVVRCGTGPGDCVGPGTEQVRATLLAARPLGALVVLDLAARPEVASLAIEFGAAYVASDRGDLDGLARVAELSGADALLLLEAGDVPHPSVLRSLTPHLAPVDVAIVQASAVATTADSAEHMAGGRHDRDLERRVLGPALGRRGVGVFTGSGALLRRSAVAGATFSCVSPQMARADLTIVLFAAGWRIVAPGGPPLVAAAVIDDAPDLEVIHACDASAARRLLIGSFGAFRLRGLRPTQRLAVIAMTLRPLSGIRRSCMIAVLIGSMLSGGLPLSASMDRLALLWLPWFVCSSAGLWLLSGGVLVPGDRMRASMRLLGASWRGALSPDGRAVTPERVLSGAFGVHAGAASTGAVIAISIVIGLRALSDRVTHTLAPMPLDETVTMLGISLWLLAGALDSLRMLARRTQARRSSRVVSSLPSTFADHAALVVDLTPLGAGVVIDIDTDGDLAVGSFHELDVVVPTVSGCVSAAMPVVVRNVRHEVGTDRRAGVEFQHVQPYIADALSEFCIVQPALELLGAGTVDPTMVSSVRVVVKEDRPVFPRRVGLRVAALVAVVGATASAVPTSAEASAAGVQLRGAVTVQSTDVTTGPAVERTAAGSIVTALCSTDAGGDGSFGTSDDRYTSPVSSTVGPDGSYDVSVDGDACWMWATPGPGFMARVESGSIESITNPQVIDLRNETTPAWSIVAAAAVSQVDGIGAADTGVLVEDVIWLDLDGDRIASGDEPRLRDVTVSLLDRTGSIVASTASGDDGAFRFPTVIEGEYRLQVADLPGDLRPPDVVGVLGQSNWFEVRAGDDVDLGVGLRPADASAHERDAVASDQPSRRVLARPADSVLREPAASSSNVLGLVVALLALLLGGSVVLGSLGSVGSVGSLGSVGSRRRPGGTELTFIRRRPISR